MSNIPIIFNRDKVKNYRNRAAKNVHNYDFLLNEVASRLLESLYDLKSGYKNILNIGCGSSLLAEALIKNCETKLLVNQDISVEMAKRARQTSVVADEEKMPYAQNTFDLVVANLTLHTVNDLPGSLIQIRKMLTKEGVFRATIFGAETLTELRQVLLEVESEISGGTSPRVFPFSDVKTMGSLMQRVGFVEPVADFDNIKISYENVYELLADIRGCGEANSLIKSGKVLNKRIMARLDEVYKEKYPDGDGGIISTFNITNITGLAAFGV
jgi:NADH dehydrogenase [ubiquinone] 1 alpha subcomplex assembly factor 5